VKQAIHSLQVNVTHSIVTIINERPDLLCHWFALMMLANEQERLRHLFMHHYHISCATGSPCSTFGIENLMSNGKLLSEVGHDEKSCH
jgi:hypothetical protein